MLAHIYMRWLVMAGSIDASVRLRADGVTTMVYLRACCKLRWCYGIPYMLGWSGGWAAQVPHRLSRLLARPMQFQTPCCKMI